jgi:hypothetical protein
MVHSRELTNINYSIEIPPWSALEVIQDESQFDSLASGNAAGSSSYGAVTALTEAE